MLSHFLCVKTILQGMEFAVALITEVCFGQKLQEYFCTRTIFFFLIWSLFCFIFQVTVKLLQGDIKNVKVILQVEGI